MTQQQQQQKPRLAYEDRVYVPEQTPVLSAVKDRQLDSELLQQQQKQRKPRPIVVSQKRYTRLLNHATNIAKLEQQKELEQQQKYQEQLKAGGLALLKLFDTSNLHCTQEERIETLKKAAAAKKQKAAEEFNLLEYKATQERMRQERIRAAQELVEKLRPGPRALKCAQLQSEIIHAVNVQRKIQQEEQQAMRAQREAEQNSYNEQALNGLKEAHAEQMKRFQEAQQHKLELQQAMAERAAWRANERAQQQEAEQAEREIRALDDLERQKKERIANAKKCKELRQNALEAMHMAEQQIQREAMITEVETCKCDIYNAARMKLDKLISNETQKMANKRIQKNELLAKELAPRLHYSATKDEQRRAHELQTMRKVFSAAERTRREKLEALRLARIATQQQEQAAAKETEKCAAEQRQHDIELRIQNAKISDKFELQQRQQFLNNAKKLRNILNEQMADKTAEAAKPEYDYNKHAQLESLKQDKFFFDYAAELLSKAKAEKRPLLPFLRTVKEYQKEQRIGAEIKIPKHLNSKLTIGLRTPGDSKAVIAKKIADEQIKAQKIDEEQPIDMESIRESCKKIIAMATEK